MRTNRYTKFTTALLALLAVSGCSKDDSSQQEVTDSFKALVMGGKSIDPSHTWTTATTMPVRVSISLESGKQYLVYFYLSNPSSDDEAAYVGMAKLRNGEQKTVYANVPTGTTQLYAACYEEGGTTAICKPVSGSEVEFSGKITSSPGTPSPTSGNNWSVPIVRMPDTSKYTTGQMVSPENVDPEWDYDRETHIQIGNNYTGVIPGLNTHTNLSVYVTGTWTLTFDQRANNGNVIVVGNGGKIVVPSSFRLTTMPQFEERTPGMIYVLPGGEISGDGMVEFTDGRNTYSYNAGTITCSQIRLASGTLYNSGTIGTSSGSQTTVAGEATSGSTPGQLYNYGEAYLMQTSGSSFALFNANKMSVTGALTLSSNSYTDNGTSIECGSMSFYSTGNTNSLLYMGNGAYLNCSGSASFRNYGIWGPSGSSYHDNAMVSFSSCINCTHTAGDAKTYLLDHIQLLLPPAFSDYEKIDGWVNGTGGGIESSRQTCYYSFEGNSSPDYGGMYYAFEVPTNGNKDFDYNDLILQVSAPYDNNDGTFSCFVNIAAVGTEMSVNLYYNGVQIGKEIHGAMSIGREETVNTDRMTVRPLYIGEITFGSSGADISRIPFTVQVSNSLGTINETFAQPTTSQQAPLYIAVNADIHGKWRWCKKGSNIGMAFRKFSTWASDQQSANDWYGSAYTSSTYVIPEW